MAKKLDDIAHFLSLSAKKNLNAKQRKQMERIATRQTGSSSPMKYKTGTSSPLTGRNNGFNPKHHKNQSSGGGGGSTSGGTHGIDTSGGWAKDGLIEKGSGALSWGGANIKRSLAPNQTVLGAAAGHAMRGAIGGGLAGGTMEAAQGGDFWAGAKSGAFNGAVGWGGYRMGMRATGATSLNPFAKGNASGHGQGLFTAAGRMANSMSTKSNVAQSAATLLSHQQRLGMSDAIYNGMK